MTHRTLLLGEIVVTPGGILDDGALVIEDTTIVEVGPREILVEHGPFADVLGGPSTLVMPGFVNAHYHSECWTGPGLIGTIFEFANLLLGTAPEAIDEESLRLLALYGLVQCVKGGQTSCLDAYYGRRAMPHFGSETVLAAYEEIGMRVAFALSLRDQNTLVHEADAAFLTRVDPQLAAVVRGSTLGYAWPVEDVIASALTLLDAWHGRDDRIQIQLAPDWTPACSDELLLRSAAVARGNGLRLTTHVLETRSEMAWNFEHHGMPAMRHLDELGYLGPDLTISHFVWATDEDIARAADSGTVVATNPGSNLRLSSGICRVKDLLAAGASVAFGTDGISIDDREDFFAELRLALMLQRQPDRIDEHRIDSATALRAMGDNGARAIGWEGRVGRLEAGALADILLLDTSRILFPRTRYQNTPVLDVLLDRADATDIALVMIHGRVVAKDGACTTVDERRLRAEIEDRLDRLYPSNANSERLGDAALELWEHALPMYERWYAAPITSPAAAYNSRRPIDLGS